MKMNKRTIFLSVYLFALFASMNLQAQSNKKTESKTSEIIVSCSNQYVGSKSIVIWWSESDYHFPIRVQDGFNNEVYLGQVTSNAFTWDRGINVARLDRYTGLLTLTSKDSNQQISTANCVKVEKKF